jgi:hypothetical protein
MPIASFERPSRAAATASSRVSAPSKGELIGREMSQQLTIIFSA